MASAGGGGVRRLTACRISVAQHVYDDGWAGGITDT